MIIKMKKVKKLIFYTPPLQNHYFWGPMEAGMARQSGWETIFWTIDIDEYIAMHVQEIWDALGCGWGGCRVMCGPESGARASTECSESNYVR